MIDGRILQAKEINEKDIPHMIKRSQEINVPLLLMTLKIMKIPVTESPELLEVIEAVAAAMGIIESVKMIPYDLRNEIVRLPDDIIQKYLLNYNTIWDKHQGIPNPDLFDAALE